MKKLLFKFSWVFALSASMLLTYCTKDDNLTSLDEFEVENFIGESLFSLQEEGNCGRFGCYEFVFPVSINFADGTTAEVSSYEELIETLRTWKENNPNAEEKPSLGFPLEVVSEEDEVITVADKEELRELKRECRRNFFGSHGPRGHRNRGQFCFDINYPLTLQFPDGTTAEAADRRALKSLAREWKQNNPEATERPEIVFPIEVTQEDGSVVSVADKEALQALKESCSDE